MTTFVTGFPGFLGTALVERLVADGDVEEVTCLVQSAYRQPAEERATAIEREHGRQGVIELVTGDIAEPGLGLGDRLDDLQRSVTQAYHLAAIYDLGVPADRAARVNVRGTQHVLQFLRGADSVERLHYVSTCYVSGRYEGRFTAEDLVVGQRFNNHYEASKFQAEVAVRSAMADGLSATVYRPGIVVGDSTTGETRKYDGPYQVIRFLLRQPGIAIAPLIGDPSTTELNVVPRDFVVEAIDAIRRQPAAAGETYQLANPDPPTINGFVDSIAAATGQEIRRISLSRWILRGSLEHLPGLERVLGIQPELVDYFDHPTTYGTSNTDAALSGTDVRCPRFEDYVDRLVTFVREHPDLAGGPMA